MKISKKNILLHKDSHAYSSFPWVIQDADGNLRLVFRQAGNRSVTAAKKNAVTHHDPDSWITEVIGRLEEDRWVPKSTQKIYSSEFGVNDPALTCLKNGDLILRVSEIHVVPTAERGKLKGPILSHRVEHGLVSTLAGLAFIRAPRGDWSKSTLTRLDGTSMPALCSREPVIEFADGSLGLSAYYGAPATSDRAVFIRSFDQGATWGDVSIIAQEHSHSDLIGLNFNETSVANLGEGRMLAMIRCDENFITSDDVFMPVGGVGSLQSAYSFNSGLSWSKPQKTPLFGQPAHLLPLSDERLLCTYGYRKKPFGVRALISENNGASWNIQNEIVLRDDGISWDLGYPMTLELKDGSLFTVYYLTDENGTRYIEGTRWKIS